MELMDIAGSNEAEALQALSKQGTFLTKLSTEVDSLIINLDQPGCPSLLKKMDQHAPQGEALVEMEKLRSLCVTGGLKKWQQLEQPLARLFQLLRPAGLEELTLVGVDSMKVVKALLSQPALRGTLVRLKLGLHGFHFLAQEDLLALGAPLDQLRAFRLFGVDANGAPCRDSFCRMFLCGGALLDYLWEVQKPEEVEALHIANAGIMGDDHQIVSLLRCLASFTGLRSLRLPLPSLPLSLRELLSLRLALPRLFCFTAEHERIEGAETWPDGEEWPSLTRIWPSIETITPMSLFSREFANLLSSPDQAAVEWRRLSESEQRYWVEAVPKVQAMYRQCENRGSAAAASVEPAVDTAAEREGGRDLWRAVPSVRSPRAPCGEGTANRTDEEAFDAQRASTHSVEDWRTEERAALRGYLAVKASDVCKDKARLRKEPKTTRANEGCELRTSGAECVIRAVRDFSGSFEAPTQDLGDCPGGTQRDTANEELGDELGNDSPPTEL